MDLMVRDSESWFQGQQQDKMTKHIPKLGKEPVCIQKRLAIKATWLPNNHPMIWTNEAQDHPASHLMLSQTTNINKGGEHNINVPYHIPDMFHESGWCSLTTMGKGKAYTTLCWYPSEPWLSKPHLRDVVGTTITWGLEYALNDLCVWGTLLGVNVS